MGLDTYVDITIRPKNLLDDGKRTIPLCRFRKCYSIANDIAKQMREYFNLDEGDFVKIDNLSSKNKYSNGDLEAILLKVRDILIQQTNRIYAIKENDESVVDIYDAFWDIPEYLICCYRNLSRIDLFLLFLHKQINIEGLEKLFNFIPDGWENLNIDECELGFEFCNSY